MGFVDHGCAKSGGTTRSSSIRTNMGGTTRTRRISTSHYSTEKSASSGYYGSNLYSADGSSVEEHIYSEPVIIEHVQVHQSTHNELTKDTPTSVKHPKVKERQCLNSLNKSISHLEKCLVTDNKNNNNKLPDKAIDLSSKSERQDQKRSKHKLPNSISNNKKNRRMSLSRDATIPRPIWPGESDDSLSNINLDAFNLKSPSSLRSNDSFNLIQFNTPKSEKRQSTNTNTDSGKGTSENSNDDFIDMIDYHQTRNVLVNIRSKLETLLEQHRHTMMSNPFRGSTQSEGTDLESNIIKLKSDLENYLIVMNEKSEYELRRFSTTISNDSKVQTITKAFNQSRICRFGDDCYEVLSGEPFADYSGYNSQIKTPLSRKPSIEKGDFILTYNDQINPFTATPRDTIIQIVSDNSAGDSSDSINCNNSNCSSGGNNNNNGGKSSGKKCNRHGGNLTQMQKNLAFSQLLNDSFNSKYGGDREKMLNEWHRDKPSIWEMYYGTNRFRSKIEQAMIREYKYGNKSAMNVSYVSIFL